MATRKPPPPPAQAKLNADQMRKGVARLERLIGEIEAFDASSLVKRWSPEQKALEATIEGTLTSVFGLDTVEYRRFSRATGLDHGGISMSIGRASDDNSHEARRYVAEGKAEAVHILKSAIKWLQDEIGDAGEPIAERSARATVAQSHSRKKYSSFTDTMKGPAKPWLDSSSASDLRPSS